MKLRLKKIHERNKLLMTNWDNWIYIKREFHLGKSTAQIAKELKISQEAVEKILVKSRYITTYQMQQLKQQAHELKQKENSH